MKPANFPGRKDKRREEAAARQAEFDALSDADKNKRLLDNAAKHNEKMRNG